MFISRYDWLEIRDKGNNSSPTTNKKLCGNNIPKPLTSTGNELTFRFVSDSSENRGGYNIKAELGTIQLNMAESKMTNVTCIEKITPCHNLAKLFIHIATKCYCGTKAGKPGQNEIMCDSDLGFRNRGHCASDEWCIGASNETFATELIDTLCAKGNAIYRK